MSWVKYDAESHFPIQNLPYGVFVDSSGTHSIGVAIGDKILNVRACAAAGLFSDADVTAALQEPLLNKFMSLGPKKWSATRASIRALLATDSKLTDEQKKTLVVEQKGTKMVLPIEVGDYTDFYASREHATNIGSLFRDPKNALLENWLHLPVGYHGRASSVVVSGTDIHRPHGQLKPKEPAGAPPTFGPCRLLDYELEMGAVVGVGTALGEPVRMGDAEQHLFGMVLLNDWSARDIQKWEYVPLGPFLGKNFATSISPWVVTYEALEPFRCASPAQGENGDPKPLEYLQHDRDSAYDVQLRAEIVVPEAPGERHTLCTSNLKHMYWSCKQQLVHHTCNGCNVRPGDLLGTGTISGPGKDNRASLIEVNEAGKHEIEIAGGKAKRKFMADGDELILSGYAQGDGYRVGFGEVTGKILPAVKYSKTG